MNVKNKIKVYLCEKCYKQFSENDCNRHSPLEGELSCTLSYTCPKCHTYVCLEMETPKPTLKPKPKKDDDELSLDM